MLQCTVISRTIHPLCFISRASTHDAIKSALLVCVCGIAFIAVTILYYTILLYARYVMLLLLIVSLEMLLLRMALLLKASVAAWHRLALCPSLALITMHRRTLLNALITIDAMLYSNSLTASIPALY